MSSFLFVLLLFMTTAIQAKRFILMSPDLKRNTYIDKKHHWNKNGCNGKNISPALEWKNPPKGTESFALTVFDPDVSSGSGWWHWVVVNIPKNTKKILPNASIKKLLPQEAKEIRNDFGEKNWGGPCPPPGETHHYVFTIHALKIKNLPVDETTSPAKIGTEIQKNLIHKTSLTIKGSR